MNNKLTVQQPDVWQTASVLLWDSDLMANRFILAIAEIFWAIILFLPGNTFSQLSVGVYSATHYVAEAVFGLIFLVSGMLQLSIILYKQYHTTWAKMFSAFNAVLWVWLVFSIITDSYPPVAGIAGEIALMLSAGWIFIRPYILAEGLYRVGIGSKQ